MWLTKRGFIVLSQITKTTLYMVPNIRLVCVAQGLEHAPPTAMVHYQSNIAGFHGYHNQVPKVMTH